MNAYSVPRPPHDPVRNSSPRTPYRWIERDDESAGATHEGGEGDAARHSPPAVSRTRSPQGALHGRPPSQLPSPLRVLTPVPTVDEQAAVSTVDEQESCKDGANEVHKGVLMLVRSIGEKYKKGKITPMCAAADACKLASVACSFFCFLFFLSVCIVFPTTRMRRRAWYSYYYNKRQDKDRSVPRGHPGSMPTKTCCEKRRTLSVLVWHFAPFSGNLPAVRETQQVTRDFSVNALYVFHEALPFREAEERLVQAANEEEASQKWAAGDGCGGGGGLRGDIGVERVLRAPCNRLNVDVPELFVGIDSHQVRAYVSVPLGFG